MRRCVVQSLSHKDWVVPEAPSPSISLLLRGILPVNLPLPCYLQGDSYLIPFDQTAHLVMSASSWIMLVGVAFLFIPIPPFATIVGAVLIVFGALMKKLG